MSSSILGVVKLFTIVVVVGGAVTLWQLNRILPSYSSQTRQRGCLSKANSIDKAVGVWESQHKWIPDDRDMWIEFRTDGVITAVSKDLEAWQMTLGVPEQEKLKAGSNVLRDIAVDVNVFLCPSRDHVLGLGRLKDAPETNFHWLTGREPRKELGAERKRGTYCIPYQQTGEPEDPAAVHRLGV